MEPAVLAPVLLLMVPELVMVPRSPDPKSPKLLKVPPELLLKVPPPKDLPEAVLLKVPELEIVLLFDLMRPELLMVPPELLLMVPPSLLSIDSIKSKLLMASTVIVAPERLSNTALLPVLMSFPSFPGESLITSMPFVNW